MTTFKFLLEQSTFIMDSSKGNNPYKQLDMSCFPLLRIDQLHLHQSKTLVKSQDYLPQFIEGEDNQAIREYGNRLIKMINIEISKRTASLTSSQESRGICIDNSLSSTSRSSDLLYLNQDYCVQSAENSDAKQFNEKLPGRKSWDQQTAINSCPTIPQRDYYITSNNSSKNGGFKERAKARSLSVRARMFKDSDQYRMELLEKKKAIRRKLAEERIIERERRKQDLMIKKRQLKQLHKESRAKLIQEMKHDVQNDMEKVAKSLILEMEKDTQANADSIQIDAAAAATVVMQRSEVDILASDSGSSLASDVDFNSDLGSVCEENEEASDPACTLITKWKVNGDEKVCYNNYITPMCNQSGEIDFPDTAETEILPLKDDDIDLCEGPKSSTDHSEISPKTNKIVYIPPSNNDPHPHDETEWRPWAEMRKLNAESHSVEANSEEKAKIFTDILPTFRSVFTTFTLSGTDPMFDRNHLIERECLEYQIKVFSSMTGITKDHNFVDKLFFSTKTIRLEINTIIDDVMMNYRDGVNQWETSDIGVGNCWNLLWTWKKPKIKPNHLLFCQKISRFQNSSFLTRKDYLKKQIQRVCSTLQNRFKNSWNIMPLTFVLPTEFTSFLSTFSSIERAKKPDNSNMWIMKPVGMSRGRGIMLINDISKVTYSSPTVIQKYLTSPLLFEDYKFDLRLYILVTSFSPLEAFIYEEGFARFSSRTFSLNSDTLGDEQIHLTNSSIQYKYHEDISLSHPARMAGVNGGGNKVRLSWLWERLRQQGLDVNQIQKKVKDVCLKALIIGGEKIPFQPNSFELFGFDVMIDKEEKPWLIEVNACPCLARENDLDVTVKEALIEDTFKIISPLKFNRQALSDICKRRLHQKKQASDSFMVSERDILEQDLRSIFGNKLPRQYGEEPGQKTKFERLAPGEIYEMLMKQRR